MLVLMDSHCNRRAATGDPPHVRLAGGNVSATSSSPLAFEYWCGDDDDYVSLPNADDHPRDSTLTLIEKSTGNDANDTFELQQVTGKQIVGENEAHSSSSGSGAPTVSRRRKKPKGFPKRPLSGYNIFFKEERVKVIEEFRNSLSTSDSVNDPTKKIDRTSVSFQDLGKIIGRRWKALSDEDRRRLEDLADQDNLRYRSEMDEYNDSKRKRNEERCQRALKDDYNVAKPTNVSNPVWNTMILSHPSELNPSLQPPWQGRSNFPSDALPMQENWQSTDHARKTTSTHLMERAFTYPIPPGMVVTLPDANGFDRSYKVQYNFYKMTRNDAEVYMNQLARTPSVTPYGFTEYPLPPPGATYVHTHSET